MKILLEILKKFAPYLYLGMLYWWVRAELKDFQLGSAWLVTFSSQLENQKSARKSAFFAARIFFSTVFSERYQSFLEEKLFATKKTEIRVNKVTILVKKKKE